ncbi:MAG: hypothetical protein H6541_02790 [Lentimicrobiaceae bacterium]|nr:hypothetical protein [Lentimicrobiaceae bacterium]
MKTLKTISALLLVLSMSFGIKAMNYEDEKLNLPGDNLNLYAVMKLFQESETLEGFERSLNAEDSRINNLDLNGNNLIDYIKVIDYVDGGTHTIVLQVAINERENQDVAVFTVYKDKRDQVHIQLVGDEYLYGKDYIIEPNDGYAETPNPGYTGNTTVVTRTTYVEVRTWPVVRYIYTPTYVVWRSPWYWNYYPTYWNPWRPYYWDYYYGYHSHWHNHYYSHYRHCNHYRYSYYADNYYHRHRAYSSTVRSYRDNGRYRDTYSRPDLRSAGSDDYKRQYASTNRSSARPDDNSRSRANQDIRQGSSSPRVNPAPGRTSGRTSGNSTMETKAGRSDNRQGVAVPATRQDVSKPKARSEERRAVKPETRTTETRQRSAASPARQDVSRTQARTQERSSTKPEARSTENRQRSAASPARQDVSKPKMQTQERSSARQSMKVSENRSSGPARSVKPSGNSAPKAAARTSAQPRKSGSSEKSSKSGR